MVDLAVLEFFWVFLAMVEGVVEGAPRRDERGARHEGAKAERRGRKAGEARQDANPGAAGRDAPSP